MCSSVVQLDGPAPGLLPDVDGDVAAVIHRAEMQLTVLGEDRTDTRPRFVVDPCALGNGRSQGS